MMGWSAVDWYHLVNMFFFALAAACFAFGFFYGIFFPNKAAYAREPAMVAEKGESPTPYVMIV